MRVWQVDPVGHTETLLRVAREAYAAEDAPSEALRSLVEEGHDVSRARLGSLVQGLTEHLELEPLTGARAQEAAVAALARRMLAGDVTPRELTYWVTRVVGLRGGRGAQELMGLEQEYCERLGEDVPDLDERVRTVAGRLVDAGADETGEERTGLLARWRGRLERRSR